MKDQNRQPAGTDMETIRRIVRESRAAQGLPPHVQDPATLERVAAILYRATRGTGPE